MLYEFGFTCVHMPVCERLEATVSHQVSCPMIPPPLFEAGSLTELEISFGWATLSLTISAGVTVYTTPLSFHSCAGIGTFVLTLVPKHSADIPIFLLKMLF